MKINELQQRFSINVKNKEKNQKMIENVKRSFM